jgi:hypothetical protein
VQVEAVSLRISVAVKQHEASPAHAAANEQTAPLPEVEPLPPVSGFVIVPSVPPSPATMKVGVPQWTAAAPANKAQTIEAARVRALISSL